MSASSRTRSPSTRAALPRTSSSASGFFFCGIRLEPVVKASGSAKKPNSGPESQMRSSARRARCVWSCAQAKTNSAAKSRSITASSAFSRDRLEARGRAARASRSRGSAVPASAPEPSGSTLTRRRASQQALVVAHQRPGVGGREVAEGDRLGRARVGEAGHDRVGARLALVAPAPAPGRAAAARRRSMAPRIQRRSAVTACSLRLRPRWPWPARSPTISPRRVSTKLCTSSASSSRYAGVRLRRAPAPAPARRRGVAASAAGIAPQRPSARA